MKDSLNKAIEGSHSHHQRSVSRAGAWLSLICAIHCMAMPLLAGSLPALSAALHTSKWLEFVLISSGFGLGVISILKGYSQHRNILPAVIMIPALILVGAELTGINGDQHILIPIGAGMAAIAQLLNFKFSTRKVDCDC